MSDIMLASPIRHANALSPSCPIRAKALSIMANLLLERAAHQRPAATPRGALERLFTLMFQGFVYNQIWEDPSVDLEALELEPHHRLVTIASGGCNILNYLAAAPAEIFAARSQSQSCRADQTEAGGAGASARP